MYRLTTRTPLGSIVQKKHTTTRQLIDSLARYEDMKENDMLLELPCSLDSEVYEIVYDKDTNTGEVVPKRMTLEYFAKMRKLFGIKVFVHKTEAVNRFSQLIDEAESNRGKSDKRKSTFNVRISFISGAVHEYREIVKVSSNLKMNTLMLEYETGTQGILLHNKIESIEIFKEVEIWTD